MTFLLQKFNAINRSRTEVRARNGLRPTASGIAFTGRLAVVCLLLAGFLGVGSAIAQPHVLRMGGGAIMVEIPSGDEVHHYLLDTDGDGDFSDEKPSAAGTDPTGRAADVAETNTFLVGSLALVAWDGTNNMLMVTPVATGIFKIATSPRGAEDLTNDDDDVDTNQGTPHEFVVMSVNSPQIVDANNAAAQMPATAVALQLRDKTSVVPDQFKDLNTVFTDQNDVFLTYRAEADKVGGEAGMRRPVAADAKDSKAILAVSTAGAKLTISLTKDAADGDMTDVWLFATDGAGEYARWQVPVSVGVGSSPYVVSANAPGAMVLREDDLANTDIDFSTTFMAGAVPTGDNPTGVGGTLDEHKIEISDASAAKVGTAPDVTYIVPTMVATVSGMGTKLNIRPRAAGAITFTATATDKGNMCRLRDTSTNPDTEPERAVDAVLQTSTIRGAAAYCYTEEGNDSNDPNVMGYVPVTGVDDPRDAATKAADAKEVASVKAQFRFAQSTSHSVTVTVVTKTSPMADEAIGGREVVADGDAITVDLEDLNGDKTGEPAAFADPTKEGLTYTATPKDSIAVITVEGSMMTITPIWRSGTKPTTVTVMATNNLDETSLPVTFTLTVKTATKPVVNMNVAVHAVLAMGIMLNTGDEALVVNLTNLTNLPEKDAAKHVALFIDPNAATGDALPGGLLYKMQVKDVVADHRYDDQSSENDVTTSAMRLVLDPAAATLTVTPTGANSAMVTVWGIDRERLMISATTMITVVSGVGTENEELPTEVALSQNYPNPFNPQTTIDYALPQAGDVSLVVYDMLGREVDVLLDGPQAAGRHTVRFGANHLPNGTYVYRLVAADKTITRTMVLVK